MRRWGEAVPGLQQSDALVFEDRDEMGEKERTTQFMFNLLGKMMEHDGTLWKVLIHHEI